MIKPKAKLELYKDRNKQWRWRVTANNGRKIANGGEGYKNRKDCLKAIKLLGEVFVYASKHGETF